MITIDPGIGGTSLVFWKEGKVRRVKTLISSRKKDRKTWKKRVHFLFSIFEKELEKIKNEDKIEKIVMEMPYTAFSGRKTIVANEKQTVVKLALLSGGLWSICLKYTENFQWIKVQEWKGQLNKEITKKRVIEKLNGKELIHEEMVNHPLILPLTEHDYDALGIGLYLLGLF